MRNVIRELIVSLGFDINKRPLDELENRIDRIPGKISPVVGQLRNMFVAAAAGLSLGAGVREFVKAGDEITKVNNRLRESAQVPAEAFELIYNSARETGVAMMDTSAAFMRFAPAMRAAGFGDGAVISTLDGLQKSLIAAGSSAAETGSILTQLGQAVNSNNFAGDELKSFLENAPPALVDEFAKALGVAREEIKKLGSEGKLTNKNVLPALIAAAKASQNSFGRMQVTVDLALARARVAWTRFAAELNSTMGLNDAIVRGIQAIGNSLDWLRTKLPAIMEFINQNIGLQGSLEALGIAMALVFGPSLVRMLGAATAAAMRFAFTVGLPALGIALLALAIQDVITYMQGGESVFGRFVEQLNPEFVKGFSDGIRYLGEALNYVWEKLKEVGSFVKDVLVANFQTAFESIASYFGIGREAVTSFGNEFQRVVGIITAGVAAILSALVALKVAKTFLGGVANAVGLTRAAAGAAAAGATGAGAAAGAGAAGAAGAASGAAGTAAASGGALRAIAGGVLSGPAVAATAGVMGVQRLGEMRPENIDRTRANARTRGVQRIEGFDEPDADTPTAEVPPVVVQAPEAPATPAPPVVVPVPQPEPQPSGNGSLRDEFAGVLESIREETRRWVELVGGAGQANPAFADPNAASLPTEINNYPNQTLNNSPTISQNITVTVQGQAPGDVGREVGQAARNGAESAIRLNDSLARDLLRSNPMTEAGAR